MAYELGYEDIVIIMQSFQFKLKSKTENIPHVIIRKMSTINFNELVLYQAAIISIQISSQSYPRGPSMDRRILVRVII